MNHDPLAPAFAKTNGPQPTSTISIPLSLEIAPDIVISEINSDRTEEVWRFKRDLIPSPIQSIAADALQMLIAYADFIAPSPKKHRYRSIGFPARQSKKFFEHALTALNTALPGDVIEFLEKTEAYPVGQDQLLAAVHEMDLDEKHQPILTPINLAPGRRRWDKCESLAAFLWCGDRSGVPI